MVEGERTDVIRVLEEAGARYLAGVDPPMHAAFLMQVGGARLFGVQDSEAFWDWVQALLDRCFEAHERAEICARLLELGDLRCRAECRAFVASALAERRLQAMVAAARITPPAAAR